MIMSNGFWWPINYVYITSKVKISSNCRILITSTVISYIILNIFIVIHDIFSDQALSHADLENRKCCLFCHAPVLVRADYLDVLDSLYVNLHKLNSSQWSNKKWCSYLRNGLSISTHIRNSLTLHFD